MFDDNLKKLDALHLRRRLRIVDSPCETVISVEGRWVILLASNNYLGLANDPMVKEAAINAIQRFGVGGGASRLISGNLTPHQRLESALARFKGDRSCVNVCIRLWGEYGNHSVSNWRRGI